MQKFNIINLKDSINDAASDASMMVDDASSNASKSHQNSIKRFDGAALNDPFWRNLSPKRKAAVRALAVEMMHRGYWQEEQEFEPKNEAFFPDWKGEPINILEFEFLRSLGAPIRPQWPGYRSFEGESGIFFMVPEKIFEDYMEKRIEREDEESESARREARDAIYP